jgi:hypothetical protein
LTIDQVGGPLQWWDDLRSKYHGNVTLRAKAFTVRWQPQLENFTGSSLACSATVAAALFLSWFLLPGVCILTHNPPQRSQPQTVLRTDLALCGVVA